MKHEQVNEATIGQLVDRFYARVRDDEDLGPIFEAAIGPDWDAHLETMRRFWSSVMLTSGRYKGNPVEVHRRLTAVQPAHFARWLTLFEDTADQLFAPAQATIFADKAQRIAKSLQLAMFFDPSRSGAHSSLPAPGASARQPRQACTEETAHD